MSTVHQKQQVLQYKSILQVQFPNFSKLFSTFNMKSISMIILVVAASANAYSYNSQPEIRVQSQSYNAPAPVRAVEPVRYEINSGSSDYQTQAPAPVVRATATYEAPAVRSYETPAVRAYEAPARVIDVPTVRLEFSSSASDYQAPALKASYDAPEVRVQSYDAPEIRSYEAPAVRSYDAPARTVEVPSVRVEYSSSDYQAPASYNAPAEIRVQNYDAPAPVVRSSYEAPAVRSSYEAPARAVEVPSVRVEYSSSDYQAPAEIRVQNYDAPAPVVRSSYEAPAVRSSYEAPAVRSSSYEAPARAVEIPTVRYEVKSSDYETPAVRSSYEAPAQEIRVQNYDAPAVRAYEAPAVRSYEAPARAVEVPTVRVEMNNGGYEAPALKSSYQAPAVRSSYEAPTLKSSYEAPAPVVVRSSGY